VKSKQKSVGGDLGDPHSVSCAFCGGRSSVAVPIPVTKTKTWTQKCPHCGESWRVQVWARRGISEFSVSPIVPDAEPKRESKPTPKRKSKPKAKRRSTRPKR
jgi:hypothetical protein